MHEAKSITELTKTVSQGQEQLLKDWFLQAASACSPTYMGKKDVLSKGVVRGQILLFNLKANADQFKPFEVATNVNVSAAVEVVALLSKLRTEYPNCAVVSATTEREFQAFAKNLDAAKSNLAYKYQRFIERELGLVLDGCRVAVEAVPRSSSIAAEAAAVTTTEAPAFRVKVMRFDQTPGLSKAPSLDLYKDPFEMVDAWRPSVALANAQCKPLK